MKQPTICITGGHLTPALAVIEEIKRQKLPWNIVFIGRSEAFEGGGSPAHEERLVRALGVPFHALTTGRFQRSWSPFIFLSFLKVPVGLFQAVYLLARYRPKVVLSFGGYVALPTVLAAWFLGISIITHEQTEELGLANSIIARFARRVMFARETGVPIRRVLFTPPKEPTFSVDASRPILSITGGSTGARTLNALVFPMVQQLVKSYTVIHQVGSGDLSAARGLAASLESNAADRYVVAEYFDAPDLAWIYRHTSLLIGRSGANTVAEAAALGVPAIFIPLPWAAGDEQRKNAQKLVQKGTAIVWDQKNLTSKELRMRIDTMMQSVHEYKTRAQIVAKHYPRNAVQRVVKEVVQIVG